MTRAARSSERGSALLLALVFLMVVGVIVAAALPFAGTSIRSSNNALRPNRASLYAADGAMQTAIEYVQQNPWVAEDVLSEPGGPAVCSPALAVPDAAGANDVVVEVCPQVLSGVPTGRPSAALLTLGRSAGEDGLRITGNSGESVAVGGHVFSNSNIAIPSNGVSLAVTNGKVWARTGCPESKIVSDPAVGPAECDLGSGPEPIVGRDPGYPVPLGPLTLRVPSCDVMPLLPGLYTNASILDQVTAQCDVTFQDGGVYYFDFTNPGEHTWDVRAPLTVSGGCGSGAQGVSLVFGGNSHVVVENTSFSVCGRRIAGPDSPAIAIHGYDGATDLTDGSAPASFVLRPTGATSTGFDNLPTAITAIGPGYPNDNTISQASIPNTGTTAATALTATGFDQQAIPPGSTLSLTMAHSESAGNRAPQVTVTSANGSSCAVTGFSRRNNTQPPETVPISCPAFVPVAPLTVSYGYGSANPAMTARVDGMQIGVTYAPPVVRRQSAYPGSCLLGAVGASGSCFLVETSGSDAKLDVGGVIYAPAVPLRLQVPNTSQQNITEAVIARALSVTLGGAQNALEIGTDDPRRRLGDVELVARIGANRWISSRVRYDTETWTPDVDSWVIER